MTGNLFMGTVLFFCISRVENKDNSLYNKDIIYFI